MIKINVIQSNILWKKHLKNPQKYIDKKLELLNERNKDFKKNILICSLLLSGPTEIKRLNQRFRKKNKSTDILSFPFYGKKDLKYKMNCEKEVYLGDIIINLSKIKYKDKKLKFKEELTKLWLHGLVHLFGYVHKKDKDFYTMNKIEERYLQYLK